MNHPQTRDADLPMHLYVDSADLNLLEEFLESPVVYGVTTNPSILKRDGVSRSKLPKFVERVFGFGARAVQIQVWQRDSAGMIKDALGFLKSANLAQSCPKFLQPERD
jgi:transaldolase